MTRSFFGDILRMQSVGTTQRLACAGLFYTGGSEMNAMKGIDFNFLEHSLNHLWWNVILLYLQAYILCVGMKAGTKTVPNKRVWRTVGQFL